MVIHTTKYFDYTGDQEWRAELVPAARDHGYHFISSDGQTLHARAGARAEPVRLDWETGRVS